MMHFNAKLNVNNGTRLKTTSGYVRFCSDFFVAEDGWNNLGGNVRHLALQMFAVILIELLLFTFHLFQVERSQFEG